MDHPDNLSLAGDGFDVVINAKAALDANPKCRNRDSCADILALATRDDVALQAAGPSYPVELGRLDGLKSTASSVEGNLPKPTFNSDQLNSIFATRGLSQADMIALSDEEVPEDLQGHQLTLTIHDEIEEDPQEYESSIEPNESPDSECPRNGIGFEVLRCIVYGGQAVSVTALGLTTAAAASGMSASNMMVLGSATACTGALTFYNTMWELHQGRVQQVDRYVDTYGRRERYKLHTIVSIVAYLLVSLWPPVAYSYIWPNGDILIRTLKAVAVSLLCSIALALGKVYVERTPHAFRVVRRFIAVTIVSAVIIPFILEVFEPLFEH